LPKKSGVLCFAVSGPNVYIGTLGAGVFQSKDNGRTWVAINLGLAPTLIEVQSLAVTDTLLIAAITKREQTDYSIWRMPLAAWPTSDQPMVQDYMENGDGAFQVGDFANAVFFYGKVLERDANSVQARLQRARSGLKIGDRSSLETALADVNKVLGSSPGQKDVYLVRGDIYLRLAGLASETTATKQAGDFADMAISDYQKALEASPNSREIALRIGDARLAKGDLEGALAEYGKLLEKDPNDWDRTITPHLDRAFEAYDKLGRDCDCGSYKDTWYLAGKFQDRKHQYDRAIKCYSRAIELGLTDFSAYWSRAVDYNFIGELDKALSDANTIIKFDTRSYVYKLRADIYQLKGESDKAIADYHAALKALRGEIKKTEYSEEAEQAVDKEAYEIHLGTAEAYLKKQNWSKAIDEYQAAIEFTVNPGQRRAFVLYRIGLAYQKKGDAANAQKYIQQAEAMDPKLKK
jgi:tetratricopeptide (TPR) repeat protein